MLHASYFETKGVNMLDEPLVKRLYATSGSITRKWHLAGRGGTYSYLGQQVWGEGLRGVCIFFVNTRHQGKWF